MKKPLRYWTLAFSLLAGPHLVEAREYRFKENVEKRYEEVASENIERQRVTVRGQVRTGPAAMPFLQVKDLNFDRARALKIDQKTEELISEIESLLKRPGQARRQGELKMRLAELHFDRSQSLAAVESTAWEARVREWEKTKQGPKPQLRTARADEYKRKALKLYRELEADSRGADEGKSKMIRREEVLYFLSATLMDLNQSREAIHLFEEIERRYPQSPHAFSARTTLGDHYFDGGDFKKALPFYLKVAAGEGLRQITPEVRQLQAYALYKAGWCYLNTQAPKKAVLAFQKTLDFARKSQSERRVVLIQETLDDLGRAYALSGAFGEGERFFEGLGAEGREPLRNFRIEAASISRDRGAYNQAAEFYDKLIAEKPQDLRAREFAFEKVLLAQRRGQSGAYQQALQDYVKTYGPGSAWALAQAPKDLENAHTDYVALLRREAKSAHRLAQLKDKVALYNQARVFYDLYRRSVPPFTDSPEHEHEMRFFYGELLYRLGDYPAAAEVYQSAGSGRYGSAAAYARVLSLKKASEKDKAFTPELLTATDDFVSRYPKDKRVGELLYSSAEEAYAVGDAAESIQALKKAIENQPGKATSVEAARRVLFILEKSSDFAGGTQEADAFLANAALMRAGGKGFAKELREYKEKAAFKQAETLPEGAPRAQAFLKLSATLSSAELKEKALHNAAVFARAAGDATTRAQAEQKLLKLFPQSAFAQELLFAAGESAAEEGRFTEALRSYQSFVDRPAKGLTRDKVEAAHYNLLYIGAHLEEVWEPELAPSRAPSKKLLQECRQFLQLYPRSKNRGDVVSLLLFRKGAKLTDLASLRRQLAPLTGAERQIFSEAELVLGARAGLRLRSSPAQARTQLARAALAQSAFHNVDVKFNAYERQRLDYNAARFAASLRTKLSGLERLEKDYLNVVAIGDGDTALRSLNRLSALYRTLAKDIEKAPAPKEELRNYSEPLFQKGLGFIKTCFDKASELKIAGLGLAECRRVAAELKPELSPLGEEWVPEPRWVPSAASLPGARPLLRKALESFARGRVGDFSLALDLLEHKELVGEEKAALDNGQGLWSWRLGRLEEAAKNFRLALTAPSVQNAAAKNLAALYLQVGDYAQALEALNPLQTAGAVDGDASLLLGLAFKGEGDLRQALDAYDGALQKNPQESAPLFNKALALAASGTYGEAAKLMGRFIEMSSPGPKHASRRYLRQWKEKSREKLPDVEF